MALKADILEGEKLPQETASYISPYHPQERISVLTCCHSSINHMYHMYFTERFQGHSQDRILFIEAK